MKNNAPSKYTFVELSFEKLLNIASSITLFLIGAIFITMFHSSLQAIREFGIGFITGSQWDPVADIFGALPFITGTLLTSFTALIISMVFSLSISIYISEYLNNGMFRSFLKSLIEIMAAIPSVIYGFWGLIFLVPLIRNLEMKIGVMPYGVGIFSASLVLAIMIIPYASAIIYEVMSMTPKDIKEAAYSLGANKYEVIKNIILPYVRTGIFAGIFLSLGRALGETMAVTMLIGNMNIIPENIFSPGNTLASVIVNEFAEASGDLYFSTLFEIGLILFLITLIINMAGSRIIKRMYRPAGEK